MTGTLTLSAHYPNVLLHAVRDRPDLCHALLVEAGLARAILNQPRARVPLKVQPMLYRRIADVLDDESFGYAPRPLRSGVFALACEYAASAGDVGQALRRLCHCYALISDDVALSLTESGSQARFSVVLAAPALDQFHFLAETFLCIGFRFTSWLSGQAMALDGAGFAYSPPAHIDEYAFLFPCRHEFGAAANFITFPADFLRLPVVRSTQDVREYGARAPADLVNKLLGTDSFANRVYLALSQRGEWGRQDIQAIASDLTMTERTLRRRLQAEGSSFQKVKDGLRQDTAIFHLSGDQYSIAEISEKLGYSTPGAFSRAFRNWMGMSPDDYRGR